MTRTMRIAAVVLATALAACAGDDDGGTNPGGTNPGGTATVAAGYTSTMTTALNRLEACYKAAPEWKALQMADVSADAAKYTAAVSAGKITYSATQAAACQAWVASATCAQLDTKTWDASCDAAITGNVVNGSPCNSSEECASGYCTYETTLTCPGTCLAKKAIGQSCTDSAECTSGACNESLAECVVNAPGAVGAACGFGDSECQAGLYCDSGTCAAKGANGAACSDFYAGMSGTEECGTNLGCASSYTCRTLVGAGQACGANAACGLHLYCSSANTCVRFPQAGDSCAATDWCADGSICNGTTCVAGTVAVGGACNFTSLGCVAGASCNPLTMKCVSDTSACYW